MRLALELILPILLIVCALGCDLLQTAAGRGCHFYVFQSNHVGDLGTAGKPRPCDYRGGGRRRCQRPAAHLYTEKNPCVEGNE